MRARSRTLTVTIGVLLGAPYLPEPGRRWVRDIARGGGGSETRLANAEAGFFEGAQLSKVELGASNERKVEKSEASTVSTSNSWSIQIKRGSPCGPQSS